MLARFCALRVLALQSSPAAELNVIRSTSAPTLQLSNSSGLPISTESTPLQSLLFEVRLIFLEFLQDPSRNHEKNRLEKEV
ncbi:hypothetical protein DFH11DRAFT_1577207 [Phellopilus nigrolimitatus]|nr:hypothetical protein DFH11DRAFT_1577207 [Phellopilus nigrolimitatus]